MGQLEEFRSSEDEGGVREQVQEVQEPVEVHAGEDGWGEED